MKKIIAVGIMAIFLTYTLCITPVTASHQKLSPKKISSKKVITEKISLLKDLIEKKISPKNLSSLKSLIGKIVPPQPSCIGLILTLIIAVVLTLIGVGIAAWILEFIGTICVDAYVIIAYTILMLLGKWAPPEGVS